MGHSRLEFLGVAGVALMLLAACGSSNNTPAAKVYKIGLVTDIGGLNDKSFNHLADLGLEKAKTDFKIQGDVVESKSGDDYVPNLTNFASKKYDLVIGVGFLMQTAMGTVSGQFPTVNFAVGGISIPPVNHYIAGYKWAATMVDPGIKVLVGYSNDFTDPAKCKNVAANQISSKADILFQVAGGCGLGVLQAAGQAGVYSVGVDADQKDADPSVIASALKKVDIATYTAIQNVVNGKFAGGALTFNIANDGAGYALDNLTVSADIQAALDDLKAKIKAGTLTPPADIPA